MMQPNLTQFFQTRHSWQVPWQKIKMVPGGWFLNISRLYAKGAKACVFKCLNGYEIHYERGLEVMSNKPFDCIIAHEICHIWQAERDPWFLFRYGLEMLKTYSENRYESEARTIEKEFYNWSVNP